MTDLITQAMADGPPNDDAVFIVIEREGWASCRIAVYRFADQDTPVSEVDIDLTVAPWPHLFPFVPMLTGETLETSWPERLEFSVPRSIIY